MRKPIIAGNWKMNLLPDTGAALAEEIAKEVTGEKCDVVLCVPFTHIISAKRALENTNVHIGVQNMYFEEKGAFTGEIAPDMLLALGVEYVILGHSERREYFNETDETVNKKIKKALEKGLKPIVCVGESLATREEGKTNEWISSQIEKALSDLSAADVQNLVIAYEPIWAIGTGRTASDEQANEVIAHIRANVRSLYNTDVADNLRIQYGGSMNAKNAQGLMAQPEIDGGLIGGASLISKDFLTIVDAAEKSFN